MIADYYAIIAGAELGLLLGLGIFAVIRAVERRAAMKASGEGVEEE